MITIETKGQLGNQFFEYATCRTIAEGKGYNFYIDFHKLYQELKRFNISFGKKQGKLSHTLHSDYCLQYLYENKTLPKEYLEIKDETKLVGYFQNPIFFNFNKSNIKKWFSVDRLINFVLFKELYNKYKDYCVVHIRGNDFKNIQHYELPAEYYIKSMSDMLLYQSNIKFVIITDDPQYSHDMFCDIDILSNQDHLIDFKMLQEAKYIICSNSTFSWWGTYLNNVSKKIIHPDKDSTYLWKNLQL